MRVVLSFALTLLTVLTSSACATKTDVDDIRGELAALRSDRQELERLVEELQRSVSEGLEEQRTLTLDTRADFRRQLDDMERQLVQIQALLGQSQVVLNSLRQQVEGRRWNGTDAANEATPPPDASADAGPGGGEARALYTAAIEQFRRGAYNTARTGFQEFLVEYPADELAPDAQYYLAETYREENDAERAIREYSRVVELYPNSRAAPTALYKAGLLQVEQGNIDTACEYFERVVAGYPRSDESRLARDQAERHNCR